MRSTFLCSTRLLAAALLPALAAGAFAADVTVQPASGSGFVIKDASGANERLRVQENGTVSLPGLVSAAMQAQTVCANTTGVLGLCSGGSGGGSYSADTGLTLADRAFSIAPTYQLPQSCNAEQFAQWNGTAWNCATIDATSLPAGTANQTLRYDGGSVLATTSDLQVMSDGGLLATNTAINTAFHNGQTPVGAVPISGGGARMMWYPAKAAFRVGRVFGDEWDDANIGMYSIAMGAQNVASSNSSIVLGASSTASGGDYATAIGPFNSASLSYAIAIGAFNTASGFSSIALGQKADTNTATNSFVYGDGSTATKSTGTYQFMARASGGFVFYTGTDTTHGAVLAAGNGSWTALSDQRAKDTVTAVDVRSVLDKVLQLPLSTWHYKAQDSKYRHMGPMAQDFHAAFHLGESDTGIDTIDADGVALAAIQGLNEKFADLEVKTSRLPNNQDNQIAQLRREVAALHIEVKAQRELIARLETQATEIAALKTAAARLQRATASVATTATVMQP